MTNVSGETKNSTTGFINIAGMFSYPLEKSFLMSLKHCSSSSYETVCSWNLEKKVRRIDKNGAEIKKIW